MDTNDNVKKVYLPGEPQIRTCDYYIPMLGCTHPKFKDKKGLLHTDFCCKCIRDRNECPCPSGKAEKVK